MTASSLAWFVVAALLFFNPFAGRRTVPKRDIRRFDRSRNRQQDPAYRPSPGFSTRPGINYRHRLSSARPSAWIHVQRVNGPILLISGADDQLWPSATMADSLLALRRAAGRKGDAHLSFKDAGHAIRKGFLPAAGSTVAGGGRLELGGSESGNVLAQHLAWSRAIETLMSLER